MKLKKILSGLIASAIAVTAMATSISAATMADELPESYLFYAICNNDFTAQYWEQAGADNTIADDKMDMVPVTGNGEYSVDLDLSLFLDDDFDYQFNCLKLQLNKGAAITKAEGTLTLKAVKLDGTDLALPADPISYEILNEGDVGVHVSSAWGEVNFDIVGNPQPWKDASTLTVVVEFTGLAGGDTTTPDTTTPDTTTPDTGVVVPFLAVPAALALAGIVASKKK